MTSHHIASIALMPLISLAIAVPPRERRGRKNQWGLDPDLVKTWFYEVATEYPFKITLRSVFYRLVATRDFPNVLGAYKLLIRWSKRWREVDPWLLEKFEDFTRKPRIPRPPSTGELEVWMEKDATFVLLRDILERFRIPALITKGYPSITAFRDAIRRAKNRGVKKILYYADHDPSGVDIARVVRKNMPVRFKKVALTWNQIVRYRLFPRLCKREDRRTPRYIEKFGDQSYELESLDPRVLRETTEGQLRKIMPPEYLREIELEKRAEEVVAELIKPIRERLEEAAKKMLERGTSPKEIMRRLRGKI